VVGPSLEVDRDRIEPLRAHRFTEGVLDRAVSFVDVGLRVRRSDHVDVHDGGDVADRVLEARYVLPGAVLPRLLGRPEREAHGLVRPQAEPPCLYGELEQRRDP
jgi:hypothetical protein